MARGVGCGGLVIGPGEGSGGGSRKGSGGGSGSGGGIIYGFTITD